MKQYRYILTVFLLLFGGTFAYAQKNNNLLVTPNNLVLILDMRSPKPALDSILKRAGIPGANSAQLLKRDYSQILKDGWKIAEENKHIVQFNKPLNTGTKNVPAKPFLLTTTIIKMEGSPGYPGEVVYGINKFSKVSVREQPSGATRFFLPGNLKARRVFLSGSFNQWAVSGTVMLKTDSGWISDLRLQPGIYAYKFIVDGRWQQDENNLLSEDDGFDHRNSIYYRYNYTFKLTGYAAAAKVSLAANFNNWKELPLDKVNNTWQTSLYLHDGMFLYNFNADGKLITDPSNSNKTTDDKGVAHSVLSLGEVISFRLKGFDDAKKVYLAGSFNNWKPGQLLMKRVNGEWVLPVTIAAGNYGYKFIVDGNWITDPANTSYQNEDGQTNSFICVKPNYTFKLKGYNNAKTVRVAGTFNNWEPEQYTMGRKGDEWVISFKLPAGKTRYKFIIDDNWILDPGNKLWEPNEHGTGNSVIWVEQDIFFKQP